MDTWTTPFFIIPVAYLSSFSSLLLSHLVSFHSSLLCPFLPEAIAFLEPARRIKALNTEDLDLSYSRTYLVFLLWTDSPLACTPSHPLSVTLSLSPLSLLSLSSRLPLPSRFHFPLLWFHFSLFSLFVGDNECSLVSHKQNSRKVMGTGTIEPQLNVLSCQYCSFLFIQHLTQLKISSKKGDEQLGWHQASKNGDNPCFFPNAVCVQPLSFHFPYIHSSSSYVMCCITMYEGPEVMRMLYSFFLNYWTSRKKFDSDLLLHLFLLELSLPLTEAKFFHFQHPPFLFFHFSPFSHMVSLSFSATKAEKLEKNTVFGDPVVAASAFFPVFIPELQFFSRKAGASRYTITPDQLVKSRFLYLFSSF